MSNVIVWFRNDLRLNDNPALQAAIDRHDAIVPVFVLDRVPLAGRHASANRTRFLHQSLTELTEQLRQRGSDLVVLSGRPAVELSALAERVQAPVIFAAEDYSPYATTRDARVATALEAANRRLKLLPGRVMIDDPLSLRTGAGRAYQIFTPFYNAWSLVPRRPVVAAPEQIPWPAELKVGEHPLPSMDELLGTDRDGLSPNVVPGGITAAHERLTAFASGPVNHYQETHDDLAANATSRLSAYLHFGCISPREVESALPGGEGSEAFVRQLAWRDFYHYVLAVNPGNANWEFQPRYRTLSWNSNDAWFEAWKTGRTGYPVVDAAMRQLLAEGYVHNRARLIVGSFLTKDLGLDWRLGEEHFMRWLTDGDEANNNGNWQWIASVGVDPAPLFRRLYNPVSQQQQYDPAGEYVRRYVPELANVPLEHLAEPWKMSLPQQEAAGCMIGRNYPAPIIDHAQGRQLTIDRFAAAE